MLLFALVLLIAGGVIAYVGDRLGTYIGKKRLSAWGLRPRHTAMLYTVLSGGAIALLTLCALIAYDHTIQTALLRGPELLAENRQLTAENRDQRGQILARETQATAADTRAALATQQALEAESRLRRSRNRLRTAQNSLKYSQDDLRRRLAQLGEARRHLAAVNGSLVGTRGDLRAVRIHLHSAQRAVDAAEHGVHLAQAQYDHALGTVAVLARLGRSLSVRNAELAAQNDTLDVKNQQLLTQTTFLQGAHLIYHRGQELDRRVIPTSLPTGAIRQRLDAFLDDLGHEAERAGSKPGDNGRAVRVVTETSAGNVSEEDALDALSQSIAQEVSVTPGVVVIAAARYNTFGGEQAQIEIQPYDDVLVFPRGAIIADTTVDGSLPEDEILSALQTFLTDRVRTAARSQGIIPRPDPETGEPTVGERTDSAQTLALVKQIQRIGPGAHVTARAATAAYSSGPLRLELTATPPIPVVAPAAPPVEDRPPNPDPGGIRQYRPFHSGSPGIGG